LQNLRFINIHKRWKIPKGVIRSCKSKKDRQYNDQKKRGKGTSNNLHLKAPHSKVNITPFAANIGKDISVYVIKH